MGDDRAGLGWLALVVCGFACADVAPAAQGDPAARVELDASVPCALPALPEGQALTRFPDADTLERYLIASSARCTRPPSGDPWNVVAGLGVQARAASLRQSDVPAFGNSTLVLGDRLLVLHEGHLFAVDVSIPGAPRISSTFAFERGDDPMRYSRMPGKMLRVGELVYVLSAVQLARSFVPVSDAGVAGSDLPPPPYATNSLEIVAFRLRDGALVRAGRMFIERGAGPGSARVVDDELVLPIGTDTGRDILTDARGGYLYRRPALPWTLRYDEASKLYARERPLLDASDVLFPRAGGSSGALHGVLRCKLGEADAWTCRGRAFLAAFSSVVHTSQARTFFSLPEEGQVYAIDLRTLAVGTHRVAPADRTSLFVNQWATFHDDPTAVHMVDGAHAAGAPFVLQLWSLPHAAFDALGAQRTAPMRTLWRADRPGPVLIGANGFLGTTYFAQLDGLGDAADSVPPAAIAHDLTQDAAPRALPPADSMRFEPLGAGAGLVIAAQPPHPPDTPVSLQTWALQGSPASPAPVDTLSLHGVRPLWSRDETYGFRAAAGGGGTVALSTIRGPGPRLASHVDFFVLDRSLRLRALGRYPGDDEAASCRDPCSDGARPIFVGNRTFVLDRGTLTEVALAPTVAALGKAVPLAPAVTPR